MTRKRRQTTHITSIKQYVNALQAEHTAVGAELSEAIDELYPKGQKVFVLRGGTRWRCTVLSRIVNHVGYLNVCHDRSRKHHTVYYKDLERIEKRKVI